MEKFVEMKSGCRGQKQEFPAEKLSWFSAKLWYGERVFSQRRKGPDVRILIYLICFRLALAFAAEPGDKVVQSPAEAKAGQRTENARAPLASSGIPVSPVDDLILLERKSRNLPPIEAVPDEAAIAKLTSRILMQMHYLHLQQPLDDQVSSQFLDRYLERLDNLHIHFLQSDLQEFEQYRATLDDLTKAGDISPARVIFKRFQERVEQRMAYVAELLKGEKFEFTGNDRYNFDRHKAPYPANLDDAKNLWRQHLRYEYLEEKLNREGAKSASAKSSSKSSKPGIKLDDGREIDNKAPPANNSLDTAAKLNAPKPHEEIVKTLTRRYSRILRFWQEFDGVDVLQVYLTALMRVYDPHSDYLGKSTLENFAMSMNLSLFGIGALLESEDGFCKIKELKPGPALRSKKLKPGDRIVGVAQGDREPVDVVDMKLGKVVDLIRGPKDTKVRLTVMPVDATDPSARVEVSLVRDKIKLEDEEAKAKIIELSSNSQTVTRLGLIDLPSFYAGFDLKDGSLASSDDRAATKSTTEDVARLLKRLMAEKVAGVILDLRHNGGGSLEEAINLTGLFIKEGPVVQVKDSEGNLIKDEDNDPSVLYDGPLIVLTDRFSASASEILAGALQDYGRALIVGDSSTHGKGTVQSLIQLEPYVHRFVRESTNNPGAVKVTIRKFYRPSGSSTQLKGVIPDLILPSRSNYAEVGEASLENPLAWDTIESAKYEKLNRIQPILQEVRKRSEARVAADRDFGYLQEDIVLFKKLMADKSVSLNEEVRLKEKKENEQRVEARKKERQARHEAEDKIYEITLKQVDLPGLPPPASKTNDLAQSQSTADAKQPGDEEADLDDKISDVDVTLKETKRIMLDLISLSKNETAVARETKR
jgi:carboxyl-terminal processing protease